MANDRRKIVLGLDWVQIVITAAVLVWGSAIAYSKLQGHGEKLEDHEKRIVSLEECQRDQKKMQDNVEKILQIIEDK
jgi:hypothetical protein